MFIERWYTMFFVRSYIQHMHPYLYAATQPFLRLLLILLFASLVQNTFRNHDFHRVSNVEAVERELLLLPPHDEESRDLRCRRRAYGLYQVNESAESSI
ncbi:hypothetical protein LENED_000106 [Lentinula edodes]|uniref:Uncharacterized protein n=1 Tax=Lentinula edodes TaxID=5353 RepID=A0A1Q3DUW2_LENED|nr:hypothetical protein LENED_000106 [Lentinula edodes]